jgi:hypothetical protein
MSADGDEYAIWRSFSRGPFAYSRTPFVTDSEISANVRAPRRDNGYCYLSPFDSAATIALGLPMFDGELIKDAADAPSLWSGESAST